MKYLLSIGISVVVVATGVALYHYVADKEVSATDRAGIRQVGINERGQPVIAQSRIDGMQDESTVRQ